MLTNAFATIQTHVCDHTHVDVSKVVRVVVLIPTMLRDATALDVFERRMLAAGHEGVIVRRPDDRYKHGRSTPREGLMLKINRFEDAEARVTGTEQLERAAGGAGRAASGLLGALVAVRPDGVTFRIGTGFDTRQRRGLWATREALPGRMVKYQFFPQPQQPHAAPRFPVFLGFQDPRNM